MAEKILNRTYFFLLFLILLFALFLRCRVYFFNISFWGDESALVLNVMNRSFAGLLKPLEYTQCAPYGFLLTSKILINLFGTSEPVFRILPFIASMLSVPAFYFLSKQVMNKWYSILIANYLFAVNYQLLYYTKEFKQYSVEMFIAICAVLYLSKVDLKLLSLKKCTVIGFVFFILFLFSIPSCFLMSAFFLYLIYKNKKESIKQIFFIALPFIICALPYYLIYLQPNRTMMTAFWYQLWSLGYIKFNPEFLYQFFKAFFNFSFGSNYNPLPALLLTSIGTLFIFRDKKRVNAIILLIFLSAILASIFRLYPIFIRLQLYLVPFALLIAVKVLDSLSFDTKKIFVIFTVLLFIYCFRTNYIKHLKRILTPDIYTNSVQRQNMKFMKDNASPDDIFVFTVGYLSNYIYYLKYHNIENKFIQKGAKEDLKVFVGRLLPGNTYWLYLDKTSKKHVQFLKQWAKENVDRGKAEILCEEENEKPSYFYILRIAIK